MPSEWLGADMSYYGADYDYDRKSNYPFSYGEVLPTERRVLHWQKVAATEEIATSLLSNSTLRLEESGLPDRLLATLTSYVLTDHVVSREQTVTLKIPASWWQHLKQDKLPKWFKRRYPVKMTELRNTVVFDEDLNYVNSRKMPEDAFGKPYVVETVTKTGWHYGNA